MSANEPKQKLDNGLNVGVPWVNSVSHMYIIRNCEFFNNNKNNDNIENKIGRACKQYTHSSSIYH